MTIFVHVEPERLEDPDYWVYLGARHASLAEALAADSYDGSRSFLSKAMWQRRSSTEKPAGLYNEVVGRIQPLTVVELEEAES